MIAQRPTSPEDDAAAQALVASAGQALATLLLRLDTGGFYARGEIAFLIAMSGTPTTDGAAFEMNMPSEPFVSADDRPSVVYACTFDKMLQLAAMMDLDSIMDEMRSGPPSGLAADVVAPALVFCGRETAPFAWVTMAWPGGVS